MATDPAHLVATLQARTYEGLAIRPAPTPGLLAGLLDEEMGFFAAAGGGAQQEAAAVAAAGGGAGGGGGARAGATRRRGLRSD